MRATSISSACPPLHSGLLASLQGNCGESQMPLLLLLLLLHRCCCCCTAAAAAAPLLLLLLLRRSCCCKEAADGHGGRTRVVSGRAIRAVLESLTVAWLSTVDDP